MVEVVNGGDNLADSENTNPNRKAIHIHGGMEYNLNTTFVDTEILECSEFTREINHNRRDFSGH